jgi:hypothetical protein
VQFVAVPAWRQPPRRRYHGGMEENPYKAPGKFKHPPKFEDRELTRWLVCIFGVLIGVIVWWAISFLVFGPALS